MTATQPPPWAVGFVYLFETDTGDHKIGFSTDPRKRVTAFEGLPFSVRLAHSFPVADAGVEREIHAALRRYRTRGEWFRLPPEIVSALAGVREVADVRSLPAELRPCPPDPASAPSGASIREVVAARAAALGLTAGRLARATGGAVTEEMLRVFLKGRHALSSDRLDAVFRVLGLAVSPVGDGRG